MAQAGKACLWLAAVERAAQRVLKMEPNRQPGVQISEPDFQSLREMALETFHPYCGETFEIAVNGGGPLKAVLETATPGKRAGEPGRRGSFSLLFRVPNLKYLPQGLYGLRHPRLGPMPIFLVPVSSHDSILRMEAVFN